MRTQPPFKRFGCPPVRAIVLSVHSCQPQQVRNANRCLKFLDAMRCVTGEHPVRPRTARMPCMSPLVGTRSCHTLCLMPASPTRRRRKEQAYASFPRLDNLMPRAHAIRFSGT